eukprot:1161830-Pelagomonas_calceolata.AAC.1
MLQETCCVLYVPCEASTDSSVCKVLQNCARKKIYHCKKLFVQQFWLVLVATAVVQPSTEPPKLTYHVCRQKRLRASHVTETEVVLKSCLTPANHARKGYGKRVGPCSKPAANAWKA